jgi:hypothetical protein
MAPEYLSPGVYVEEVPGRASRSKRSARARSASSARARRARSTRWSLCTNWSTFTKNFGDFADAGTLAHAVYGFFNNGGARCFVLNVGDPEVEAEGQGRQGRARYIGDDKGPGNRTGLHAFEEVDEINIVVAPGQTEPAIQDAVLTHCEKMRYRFAILDAPETIESGGVDKLPKPRDSKYGAYYFPWIEVYDPQKGNIFVPPSGHMAGIYARSDAERGVHKAPANEIVRGALGLKYNHHQGRAGHPQPQGDQLHPRVHGPRHPRVGRPHHLERSRVALCERAPPLQHGRALDRGRHPVGGLRAERRDPVEARHAQHLGLPAARLARRRPLRRATPEQAFYVKCDSETNPPEVIDAGQLVCEIGMCPVKPAEFVIFRIGQMPTGGDVSE